MEFQDLAEIVETSVSRLEGAARDKGLALNLQIPEDLSPILVDRQRFTQILTNLIDNAVKFTETGRVDVRLLCEGSRALAVEVEDTGVGIPEDALPYIFEAYERTHVPHTKKVEGAGLGLAISKSLAEMMGYTLEVESDRGAGSIFRVVLESGVYPTISRSASTPTTTPASNG